MTEAELVTYFHTECRIPSWVDRLPAVMDYLKTHCGSGKRHSVEFRENQLDHIIWYAHLDKPSVHGTASFDTIGNYAAQINNFELFKDVFIHANSTHAWAIARRNQRFGWYAHLYRYRPHIIEIMTDLPELIPRYPVIAQIFAKLLGNDRNSSESMIKLITDKQHLASEWLWQTLPPTLDTRLQMYVRHESDRRRVTHRLWLLCRHQRIPKYQDFYYPSELQIIRCFELLSRLPREISLMIVEMFTGMRLRGPINKSDVLWLRRKFF